MFVLLSVVFRLPKMLIIFLLLLSIFIPTDGVGQFGGNIGNIGKKNGGLAPNTLKSRERMMRRYSSYLLLRKHNLNDFFNMDTLNQTRIQVV